MGYESLIGETITMRGHNVDAANAELYSRRSASNNSPSLSSNALHPPASITGRLSSFPLAVSQSLTMPLSLPLATSSPSPESATSQMTPV